MDHDNHTVHLFVLMSKLSWGSLAVLYMMQWYDSGEGYCNTNSAATRVDRQSHRYLLLPGRSDSVQLTPQLWNYSSWITCVLYWSAPPPMTTVCTPQGAAQWLRITNCLILYILCVLSSAIFFSRQKPVSIFCRCCFMRGLNKLIKWTFQWRKIICDTGVFVEGCP